MDRHYRHDPENDPALIDAELNRDEALLTRESIVLEKRGKHLRELMDTFHRDRFGDYEHEYAVFEAVYFGTEDGMPLAEYESGKEKTEEIPKYASIAEDETYGMISTCDTLTEALEHQSMIPSSGEYLNVPAGIVDLDTGERIETVSVVMTPSAFAVVCGLVQPSSEGINTAGIFSGVWDELRHHFPVEAFREWAKGRSQDDTPDGDYYDEDAGM